MLEIKYDPEHILEISIGRNRFEKNWKNKKITWINLLKKLSETHRTHETLDEYLKMKKQDQDNIKDIGGYVGGMLRDGKRRNGYVISRSIITLDADYAPQNMWEDAKLVFDNAMCCYSTHKHTPQKPRLRFLIPLKRAVNPEEYEAVARKIAENFGIDNFDDTTYQPERLMYWPSTAKDGVYFFSFLDAPILDPDKVLSEYHDWRDTSFWPESSRSAGIRKKQASKQGDPYEKDGMIGAFCRTYSIEEAISKFLPDVYTKARGNRYSYAKGSTSSGLVIYEDKFAYSNHATDPLSGKLCNAFDLVRIHKFGELDNEANPDTPINRLPSFLKMIDFIQGDSEVKKTIGVEHLKEASVDFEKVDSDDKKDLDWLANLATRKNGEYEQSIENLVLILQNDPNLKNAVRYNIFTDRIEVTKKLPWPRRGDFWTDTDDAGLRYYLEKIYAIEGRQKIFDALSIVAEENAYHPVKEYLESLIWDGIPRVETVLIDYLGAEDNIYTRTVTRKTLVAAVKRIYQPGCKFDYMLTITGPQGIGKSLLIKKLGGRWASDTLTDIRGKEAYEALDGVWLMEMGELAALKRSEREAIKNYISKQEDTYRKAYHRNTTINKRQCIFIGTTNDTEFLNDSTGSRRFWVVDTDPEKRSKTVWDDLTNEERDQIWAEAMELYNKGENVMQLPEEVLKMAVEKQEMHSQESIYQSVVEEYLSRKIPDNWYKMTMMEQRQWYNASEDFEAESGPVKLIDRDRVCPQEIWFVALKKDELPIPSPFVTKEIKDCVAKISGWKRDKNTSRFGDYGAQKGCIKTS